ncbi:hypothetical protein CDAR_555871 [Caerostris darwini]|uniref:Uncharacterized protein n=1 Tax=Caerostris darwini TaxID=1538125 RepID=A0AAV4NB11_9ARAC|nr:hypothetical protein CDAR_555871 [Caerostris darwini]
MINCAQAVSNTLSLPPQDEVASNCNRNRRRLFRLTALPVLTIRSMCLSSENAQEEWVHNRLGRKLAEDLSRQLLLHHNAWKDDGEKLAKYDVFIFLCCYLYTTRNTSNDGDTKLTKYDDSRMWCLHIFVVLQLPHGTAPQCLV